MTPEEYEQRFGVAPQVDDVHRATCERAGETGHYGCGVCPKCDLPRHRCGHFVIERLAEDVVPSFEAARAADEIKPPIAWDEDDYEIAQFMKRPAVSVVVAARRVHLVRKEERERVLGSIESWLDDTFTEKHFRTMLAELRKGS